MEVYPGVSEAFANELADASARAGFDGLIHGPRRSEVFVDLITDPSAEQNPCA
jgi:hypothetical protein